MKHGSIEQVGTPKAIYREPASAFVADFVGQVNVLPGVLDAQHLHLGSLAIAREAMPAAGRSGPVKVYLRPEDLLARPIAPDDVYVMQCTITHIDFMGAFCHVQVQAPALGAQLLTVALSLNFLAEQSLQTGSPLALRLMPERIKLF
jgi:iron(III) transport system ATP-binding protein